LRLVQGWRDIDSSMRGGALALGNFDGVHRGHQAVIADAARAATALNAALGVITFEPHPRRWFQPNAEPFRLMTVGQQARALEALGVQQLHLLPFDVEMAEMSDAAFAERVLHQGLGARHIAVGFDITFGAGRTGDPEILQAYGDRLGFSVSVAPRIDTPDGVKLSSSAIREALAAGRPQDAAAILGRPFAIEGEVRHGDKRGRTIGFPTANILLGDYVRPAFGVYATRSRLPDGRTVSGVRPSAAPRSGWRSTFSTLPRTSTARRSKPSCSGSSARSAASMAWTRSKLRSPRTQPRLGARPLSDQARRPPQIRPASSTVSQ
jgi:riboflavin kinase/FMN adenylyltransferase